MFVYMYIENISMYLVLFALSSVLYPLNLLMNALTYELHMYELYAILTIIIKCVRVTNVLMVKYLFIL